MRIGSRTCESHMCAGYQADKVPTGLIRYAWLSFASSTRRGQEPTSTVANIPREAHGYVLGLQIKRKPGADRCEFVSNSKTNFNTGDSRQISLNLFQFYRDSFHTLRANGSRWRYEFLSFLSRVEKSSGSLMSDLAQIWRRLDRLVLTVYFGPDLRLVRNPYHKKCNKCKKCRTCKESRGKEHNITSLIQELGYVYFLNM